MENNVVNKKRGLITTIIAGIGMLAAIVCCILWAYMVKEHFDLQATAEDFEGLASIGIIIVGLIFAIGSMIAVALSAIFSAITIVKGFKTYKIINIVFLGINFVVLFIDILLFFILKG